MTHILQHDGFRLVAFNKSGHKSIVRSFAEGPDGQPLEDVKRTGRGSKRPIYRDLPTPLVTAGYIRHPLARLASVWNHLFTTRSGYPIIFGTQFAEGMAFNEFCDGVIALPEPDKIDFHIRPQMGMFHECSAGISHLYRLDNLSTNWAQMCFLYQLKCTRQVRWENDRSDAYPVAWTQMYASVSQTTIGALRVMYRDDMTAWRAAD